MKTNQKKLSPANLARKSIEHCFNSKISIPEIQFFDSILSKPAGAFVSLHHKLSNDLRGCIGTFLPTTKSAYFEIIENAKSASFDDPRFPPLKLVELNDITVSVDILSAPSKIKSELELNPKKYGIIVSAEDGKRGLLLPDLPGVKTAFEQISICRQKAGIGPNESIEIVKFTVTRFSEK